MRPSMIVILSGLTLMIAILALATENGQSAGKPLSSTIDVTVYEIDTDVALGFGGPADFYFVTTLYDDQVNTKAMCISSTIFNDDTASFNKKVSLNANLKYGEYCYISIEVYDEDGVYDDMADVCNETQRSFIWICYDIDVNKFMYRTGSGWSKWQVIGTKIWESGNGDADGDAFIQFTVNGDNQQDESAPVISLSVNPSNMTGTNGWYTENVEFSIAIIDNTHWDFNECWLMVSSGGIYHNVGWNYTSNTDTLLDGGEGTLTFNYYSETPSGNTGNVNTIMIKVDKTAPTMKCVSGPDPDVWVTSDKLTFGWQANADTSGIQTYIYKVDEGTETTTTGFSVQLEIPDDGAHKFYVKGVDNAGLVGNYISCDFMVDRTAPVIIELAGPTEWVTAPHVSFTWGVTEETSGLDKYYFKIDDGPQVACVSPLIINAPEDGIHAFYIRGVDVAGNVGVFTSIQFKIDRKDPVIFNLIGPTGLVTGPLVRFAWCVTEETSGLDKNYYKIDNGLEVECTSPLIIDTPLDGVHIIFIKGVDVAGNIGNIFRLNFQVDRTVPIISDVTGPTDWVTTDKVTFTWAVTEVGSGIDKVYYNLDNGTDSATTSPLNINSPMDGAHTIYIHGVDVAGNIGETVKYHFKVDRTKPIIHSMEGPIGWVTSEKLTFFWVGNDNTSGVDYYCYMVDKGADYTRTCSLSLLTPSDGAHVFFVRAIDKAGNEGMYVDFNYKVDRSLPTIESAELASVGLKTSSQSVVLAVAFKDAIDGSTIDAINYKVANQDWVDAKVDGDLYQGTATLSFSISNNPGQVEIWLRVTDKAGNLGSESLVKLEYVNNLEVSDWGFNVHPKENHLVGSLIIIAGIVILIIMVEVYFSTQKQRATSHKKNSNLLTNGVRGLCGTQIVPSSADGLLSSELVRLEEFYRMRDGGLITENEYSKAKNAILGQLLSK